MFTGNQAISILNNEIGRKDPYESSHWEYFNRNIEYKNNKLKGYKGFGDSSYRLLGTNNFLHYLFQYPFRKEGINYKNFKKYEKYARKISLKQKRCYDINCLRQTLTLSYLNKNKEEIKDIIKQDPVCCIIGDGFGFMTSLLIESNISRKIYLVNLSKVLLIDLIFLKKTFGEKIFNSKVHLVTNKNDLNKAEKITSEDNGIQIIAIEAKNYDLIQYCNFNFVMNIHSMQEMNHKIIEMYFNFIRKSRADKILFYCCNRVSKKLFDGTELKFDEYYWKKNDNIIFDEICPLWNQKTYMSKPPFYVNYDGKNKHRLVFLSKI